MTDDAPEKDVQPARLPRLALIADGFTDPAVAERTAEAVSAGVPWVHLRDHAAGEADFAEAARALAERLRRQAPADVLLSVNSRLEVALDVRAGLHTGQHGPTVEDARPRGTTWRMLVGASAHDVPGYARPGDYEADYFFFSPVFPTSSKPEHPGTGLGTLHRFCRAFPDTPVLALGGLTPERVGPCLDAGAHGAAVLSGILHAEDPSRASLAYLNVLPRA